VLEHGYKVKMVLCDIQTYSVDTPEDLNDVEEAMRNDNLYKRYAVVK
jgi:CMP-2-keto-3-deoxyoctulosonic acid synthetase